MSWATVAETLTYTGITVDSVEPAQLIVELIADVTEEANDNISTKNMRLLKMAVAYQAAWMTEHPDMFTHIDVRTMLQDGLQYVPGHANASLLAPLAKRAIDRLSWRRSRSQRIRRSRRQRKGGQTHILGAFHNTPEQDDDLVWERM